MRIGFQTAASMVFGLLFFGVLLFWPAGTFDYWQAWLFIAVFTATTIVPSIHLAVRNPVTMQRRMKAGPTAETRPVQRVIISATVVSVVVTLVVSALDHRFGWSSVPLWLIVVGNILVALGLSLAQLVIVQNAYAGASITVEQDQPLVSTGMYGVVRHPMYSGALIMMIATPLALDSLWGLVPVAASVPIMMARIADEERLLVDELAGYREYRTEVPSRLVPGIW